MKRILFATQSNSLGLFNDLATLYMNHNPGSEFGFLVSDSMYWEKWNKIKKQSLVMDSLTLKEWEVTSQDSLPLDYKLLAHYERTLGSPNLFGAIVADRRLLFGKKTTYAQDFGRRYNDQKLLSILQAGVVEVEKLFYELKPDIVCGFICVTFLEYLIYLFAKSRNITYINLRPVRVQNQVGASSTLNDPSPELVNEYKTIIKNRSQISQRTKSYINSIKNGKPAYEGVVNPSNKPALNYSKKINIGRLKNIGAIVSNYYLKPVVLKDNHVPDPINQAIYRAIINPWNAILTSRFINSKNQKQTSIENRRFCFFPLHTEPEVSLLVNSRPFINQIEVIRILAISLPADMFLIIKEHPGMVGKRRLSFYKKLLNIPKVIVAKPETTVSDLISKSTFVAVLSSSVGIQAMLQKKPVLVFGNSSIEVIGKPMISSVDNLKTLDQTIKMLLDNYRFDQYLAEAFIESNFKTSIGMNFYTSLLKKSIGQNYQDSTYEANLEKLYELFMVSSKKTENHNGIDVTRW